MISSFQTHGQATNDIAESDAASVGHRRSRFQAPADVSSASVINPYLIAIGILYIVWSWVHLPSSIWMRSIFVCYLVWRMRPDVILPMLLSSIQLKVQLGGLEDMAALEDVVSSLTGFEQYAFSVPAILYGVRTFFAVLSVRSARRDAFPFVLFGLYLLGVPFVLTGTIWCFGESGWTQLVRTYSFLALYFYGCLLPRISYREIDRLVTGLAIVGGIIVLLAIVVRLHSRQVWLLMPLIGALAPLVVFRRSGLLTCVAASVNSFVGFTYGVSATFTILLEWVAGTVLGTGIAWAKSPSLRRLVAAAIFWSLLAINVSFMLYAAVNHDPTLEGFLKMRESDSSRGRAWFKLLNDRGPLWWGAMNEIYEHPTVCGLAQPKYMIVALGKSEMWPYSAHNIILDPLLRFGVVVGPIILLVFICATATARRALAHDSHSGVQALAIAILSNVLIGGITLPYVMNEREGEYLLMIAGLLTAYTGKPTGSLPSTSSAIRS
jgi:hypothetical protein